MANQNLSQFTEKLFVADADHTFIWDTVGAISKRVSRNSWLNSGTLTSDAPVTISQTWGNNLATFKALVVNAAGTSDANSAVASKLLELQVGGVGKFSVDKYGITTSFGAFRQTSTGAGINVSANGSRLALLSDNAEVAYLNGLTFILHASAGFGWASGAASSGSFDTILLRDAANTLALRNGAAAQTFNVYGTYTSGTSYERLTLSAPSAANAIIGTNKGSGGGTARGLDLQTDGVARMTITTAGDVGIGTTAPLERLHVLGGKVLFGDATDSTGTAGNGDLTLRAWRAPQLNMVANNTSGEPFGLNLKAGATTLAGMSLNTGSGELKIGALSNGGYFPTFYSNNAEVMRFSTTGNVGIGTTSPTSKLQVTGGDVEIETVTSGIIMKAAGTATRYRITLNAGGTDLVFTAI